MNVLLDLAETWKKTELRSIDFYLALSGLDRDEYLYRLLLASKHVLHPAVLFLNPVLERYSINLADHLHQAILKTKAMDSRLGVIHATSADDLGPIEILECYPCDDHLSIKAQIKLQGHDLRDADVVLGFRVLILLDGTVVVWILPD